MNAIFNAHLKTSDEMPEFRFLDSSSSVILETGIVVPSPV